MAISFEGGNDPFRDSGFGQIFFGISGIADKKLGISGSLTHLGIGIHRFLDRDFGICPIFFRDFGNFLIFFRDFGIRFG